MAGPRNAAAWAAHAGGLCLEDCAFCQINSDHRVKQEQLNNGWPFGPGPDNWHMQVRLDTCDPDGRGPRTQAWLVCMDCGRSVFLLCPDISKPDGYAVSLAVIKPRVADHALKLHAAELAGATYR